MTFLYRYFGIKENDGTAGRSEIKVKLINKFLADIFVKTPTMKLRRINQELPIAVKKFYFQKRNAMIDKFYGKQLYQVLQRIRGLVHMSLFVGTRWRCNALGVLK